MARKRMIDPNIWQSEDFASLSTLAKIVFIGLFSNADDEGRGRAKAAYVKSILFPYDESMKVLDIDNALSEIAEKMSIIFYETNGNEYYSLTNWNKWQRVDKPSDSLIPEYTDDCKMIRRTIGEQSANNRRTISPKRKEKNISKDNINKENIYVQKFNEFWKAYPSKVSRQVAEKAFCKINPDDELFSLMMDALKKQKETQKWKKNDGQFIPNPSTWLNQKRWEDEIQDYHKGGYEDI